MRFDTMERTLECVLSEPERRLRSDEAHNLISVKVNKETDKEKLKAQAAAVGKEIDQIEGQIRTLSEAARTGKETRTVRVHKEYDQAAGEVVERRDDTGELLVRRQPYAAEWADINAQLQAPLPGVNKEPARTPRRPSEVPGIDHAVLAELGGAGGQPGTWRELGRLCGRQDKADGYLVDDVGDGDTDYVDEVLTRLNGVTEDMLAIWNEEKAELVEGLREGLKGEAPPQPAQGDDTPFGGAPEAAEEEAEEEVPAHELPPPDANLVPAEWLDKAKALGRADREGKRPLLSSPVSLMAELSINGLSATAEKALYRAYEHAHDDAGPQDDALTRTCPQCKARPGQPCKNYKGQGCATHAKRKK